MLNNFFDIWPFENREKISKNFAADFIIRGLEYPGITLYSQVAISSALFDQQVPYKNILCSRYISNSRHGTVTAEEKIRNANPDVLRLYLTSVDQSERSPRDVTPFTQSHELIIKFIHVHEKVEESIRNMEGFQYNSKFDTCQTCVEKWIWMAVQNFI